MKKKVCVDKQRNSSNNNVKVHWEFCQHYLLHLERGSASSMMWFESCDGNENVEALADILSESFPTDWKYCEHCCFPDGTPKMRISMIR